jgi:DNA recombination protein RmuC
MTRKLKSVEALPAENAQKLLGTGELDLGDDTEGS